jgi:tetratricopeptide (TPR) repeat protein
MLAAPARAALTEGARLRGVYDTILDAQFDRVDGQLKQTCPPAPVEACQALGVVSLWWQILINPESRLLDRRFTDLAAAVIAANARWTSREPQRAEAWFYLAGSYAPLVQWHVLRGERLAAAREGGQIKTALERSLQVDPMLNDAYFGIGLYHYYADVAPAAAKLLRWLLLLPGGDRRKGLQEMLQARERGELLRGEADYQLHLLYLWYEQKPRQGLDLLETLEARYPSNPLFLQRIAEVEHEYFHDHPASAAAWQTLLERARGGRVWGASLAEVRARLGLASELDAMYETDRAIDELKRVLNLKPVAPFGARAQLQLGTAYDRLGERDLAVAAFAASEALAPDDDPMRIRERARAGLRQKPDARGALAYRLSLDGWRALERGALEDARRLLSRAVMLAPEDPVARYRYARALDAEGDPANARAQLEKVIAARPIPPAVVLADAYVSFAQLLERAGERARAIAMYREAARLEGGDPRARDQARRALERLSATSSFFDFFFTLCLTSCASRP